MGFATKKKFSAFTLIPLLVLGYAAAADSQQSMQQPGGLMPPPMPPSEAPPQNDSAYFVQHFATDALSAEVKEAVLHANLAPVSFKKIVVHTHDQATTSGQPNPTTFDSTLTLEDAGHGLVRKMESMQSRGDNSAARLDLTYRGYFPFLTQTVSSSANAMPPIVETRKVLRFDTAVQGHMNFTYLYGASGEPTFADPGQVVCDSGKRYNASELNAAIDGEATELNCQIIDTNGDVTNKIKFAYLEKYAIVLMLHMQNSDSALDSSITDFKAE